MHDLFRTVAAWTAANYPGVAAVEICVKLSTGAKVRLPMPVVVPTADDTQADRFIPTAFQRAILDALDGRALRTDALGAVVGDRGRLFRKPGGIQELVAQGLVANHKRLGYYRPDAMLVELQPVEAAGSR